MSDDDGYICDLTGPAQIPCEQKCDIPDGMRIQLFDQPKAFAMQCPLNSCEYRIRVYP